MTKEELEKEAEEIYQKTDKEFMDCQDEGEIFNLGFLAAAEPREKRITELEEKLNNLSSVAEVRLANWQKYAKENDLVKSLLYCTKSTCDNCGFVNCEDFQRQRKSEPCALYISYQDRIKNLEEENAELKDDNKVMADNYSRMEQKFNNELTKAKELIHNLLRVTYGEGWNYSLDWKVKAEEFLDGESTTSNECHDCAKFDEMPKGPRCKTCDNGSHFQKKEEEN